jgi:hypothetical protein
LYLADRTSEALEAIEEAEALAQRIEHCDYRAELHWLRGVCLAATGAGEGQIEASFCEAIRIAKEQKSVSLEKRAESILRGISQTKGERVSRTRIPTTSLVTSCNTLLCLSFNGLETARGKDNRLAWAMPTSHPSLFHFPAAEIRGAYLVVVP